MSIEYLEVFLKSQKPKGKKPKGKKWKVESGKWKGKKWKVESQNGKGKKKSDGKVESFYKMAPLEFLKSQLSLVTALSTSNQQPPST